MVKNNTLQITKDYIKFRMQSVNEHGLHSPFMYSLATKCFYDKTKYPEYKKIKEYHKLLSRDNTVIEIKDYGAGSKVFKDNSRKISDISKISGSSIKEMKLLFRLTKYFRPKNILELGTSLGKSTFSMSLGNPNTSIITVEGSKSIADYTKKTFKHFDINNIEVINQTFEKFLNNISYNNYFDLVYLDGNHQKKATIDYFNKLLPFIHNNSIVILDDIYWSEEMKSAWNILKTHSKVRQSIDTFHYGFLFFREEQFPENFTIRL